MFYTAVLTSRFVGELILSKSGVRPDPPDPRRGVSGRKHRSIDSPTLKMGGGATIVQRDLDLAAVQFLNSLALS
jgi:hypothetical protein